MGGLFSSDTRPPSDDRPPAEGEPLPPAASKATELILDGTPAVGSRRAAGPLGDESAPVLDDFVWAEGNEVDIKAILKENPDITPYCFDFLRRRIILVKTVPGSMGKLTFIYMDQRQNAVNVYAVPYQMFCDAIDELETDKSWQEKVLFLQSTGRCGSTLLCKLLGDATNMVSLSEPDIYSHMGYASVERKDDFEGNLLDRVCKATTWMHYRAAVGDSNKPLCIKPRGQVIVLTECIKRAMPKSSVLYLYRDPIPTIDSFCVAFSSNFVGKLVRKLNIDGWFVFEQSGLKKSFGYMCPYLVNSDPRFPMDIIRSLGSIGLNTAMWIFNMETALALQKKGMFDIVLRYEDLCAKRELAVQKVLDAVGITDTVNLADAKKVFDEDAHKLNPNTQSQRPKNKKLGIPIFISEADMPGVEQLLSAHKELDELHFKIPGTASFE